MTYIPPEDEAAFLNEIVGEERPEAFFIVKQPDGNWRGLYHKNGKTVHERQSDPGTVMQLLITHE